MQFLHYLQRNVQYYISQDTKLHQVIGSLMEPKSKQLVWRDVILDPMFMSERENRSYIYVVTWKPIDISMSKCNTDPFNKPQ